MVLNSFETCPGSISDKDIVVKRGFSNLNPWEQDEIGMADGGFYIEDYQKPLGIGLEIPSFLKVRDQFEIKEINKSQQVVNKRIHVGRMVQHLKCYHIFDRVVRTNMLGPVDQVISVWALLSHVQEPALRKT